MRLPGPVIMQERLIQIGDWLQRNGEAIYGTHPWRRAPVGPWRDTETRGESVSGRIRHHETGRLSGAWFSRVEACLTAKNNVSMLLFRAGRAKEIVLDDLQVTGRYSSHLARNPSNHPITQRRKPGLDPRSGFACRGVASQPGVRIADCEACADP